MNDQSNELKSLQDVIKYYITSYNTFLNHIQTEYIYDDYNLDLYNRFFVLNNNNKWYCLLTLYKSNNYLFFYDNKGSTFYIQVTKFINIEYLFEGYIYLDENNKKIFKITDILAIDSIIVNKPYSKRLEIIQISITPFLCKLQDLNAYMSFQIHPVYTKDCTQFLTLSNGYIETIDNYKKTNENLCNIQKENSKKIITSTKLPDVYNVFDIDTNEKQGILYVKTIKDSKQLLELFKTTQTLELSCKFNHKFNKWHVLI